MVIFCGDPLGRLIGIIPPIPLTYQLDAFPIDKQSYLGKTSHMNTLILSALLFIAAPKAIKETIPLVSVTCVSGGKAVLLLPAATIQLVTPSVYGVVIVSPVDGLKQGDEMIVPTSMCFVGPAQKTKADGGH